MKKLFFTLFVFFMYSISYSQWIPFAAYSHFSSAKDYAISHISPYSQIYKIFTTNNINYNNGYADGWGYFIYVPGVSQKYVVNVAHSTSMGFIINHSPTEQGIGILEPLSITGINSTEAVSIAESNGGSQYRSSHLNISISATLCRSSDVLSGVTPYWTICYNSNGTLGFYVCINAVNGSVISIWPGGGGTTVLSQNFESSSFPPSGWNIYYSGTSYWSRSTSCSGYGNGSASAKFSYYSASAGTNQYLYTSVAFSPTQSNFKLLFDHAYATYNSEVDTLRIWSSTNAGNNWAFVSTLLGGTVVGSGMVTAPPIQGDFIPSANQWASKQYSLPYGTNAILFQAISAYGNNLYLDNIKVTNSVDIKKLDELIPVNFSLYQNYPNPFNPSTKIKFELPLNNQVLLKIYNINGQEVETLISQSLNAGVYEVDFDGSKYSSGVYFYTLYTNDFKETKRMILLK